MYDYMVSERGVICVGDVGELAAAVQRVIEDRSFLNEWLETARRLIAENAGASQRILVALQQLLTESNRPLTSPATQE